MNDFPVVSLNSAFVALGCLAFASAYLFPRIVGKGFNSMAFLGGKLANAAGYAIPSGPIGLPIVGQ